MSKEVIIRLRDDLDQSLTDVQTVEFGWGGKVYEIDLSAPNREAFAGVMASYVAAARPKKRKQTPPKDQSPKGDDDLARRREIRDWATRNGYKVKAQGRIPQSVENAWAAAHG